jgi:hypothetical protein
MSKQALPTYSICTISDQPASRNDLMTDHLDHYLDAHKNLQFPHKHSFYHLVYFTAGRGSHSIDFINFHVEPGQIYFMIPGQVHTWNFSHNTNGYIINFSKQYILTKHVTGRPAGELIRDRILLEAKRLLVNAEMNIAEVAAELEFEDNSYFSKFFKKYVGATPEIFKKKSFIKKLPS